MRRLGFTIIELLVVISIIAVVAGLLIVGVGKLQTTAKRRQTEQVLANCQAMFGDWEAYSRVTFSREAMASPNNVTPDLNLKSSGAFAYDQYHRFGDAEIFTQDVMYHLKTVPTNAAALAKLPANALTSWPSGTAVKVTAGTPPFAAYNMQNLYSYTDPVTSLITWFDCVQYTAVTPTTNSPDPACWLSKAPMTSTDILAQPIPLPLDAWGNPIIFVPYELGTGTTLTQTTFPVAPAGALEAAGQSFQSKSPDGRPFFASAGPDGDFSLGDDNLYSFDR